MVSPLSSPSPASRRSTGPTSDSPQVVGPDGSVFQPLASASPRRRAMSHTPPLPPSAPCSVDAGGAVNPLEEFDRTPPHLAVVNRCLGAACSSLQFDIAEVWTYAGDFSEAEGKAVQPMFLHYFGTPATIDSYGAKVEGVHSADNKDFRHVLSPELVTEARIKEDPVWYTSTNPDTPLHADRPLNTAVALPISLDAFHRDLCFVFFAEQDVNRDDTAVSVLTQLVKAAGVALSFEFPAHDQETSESRVSRASSLADKNVSSGDTQRPRKAAERINLDVRWNELSDVEFMVNGSRCTIYTAFYNSTPVVVKVMRKDAEDKDLVRQELEREMSLLMRLRHPHIVKLIGAGSHPEQFLLIERLDGGTLAQRCGNALKIRDRRRRFRHKKPFTYEEILRHGMQLAEALDYMHNDAMEGKLVVHRDLKPDNIGFDVAGNLKLIDLGLGRVVAKNSNDNAVYKMTGQTGSLRYMAPEVALGKPYNGAADVYGFSIILWEMATMTKPFEALGRDQFLRGVVMDGVRPHLSKEWPPEFSKLLTEGWHPDMNQRRSFKELKATLKSLLETATANAAQARSGPRTSGRKFGLFKSHSKGKKGTFS